MVKEGNHVFVQVSIFFSETVSTTVFPLDFLMYKTSRVMLAHYPVNEVRAISSASWGPNFCSVPCPQTTALTSVSNSVTVFSM